MYQSYLPLKFSFDESPLIVATYGLKQILRAVFSRGFPVGMWESLLGKTVGNNFNF